MKPLHLATNSLPDIQCSEDARAIPLQAVGITNFTLPVQVYTNHHETSPQRVLATCAITTDLAAALKGSHLSRFVEATAEIEDVLLTRTSLTNFLWILRESLATNSESFSAAFSFVLPRQAPISGKTAPLCFSGKVFASTSQERPTAELALEVVVPVSTACPCSKAISEEGAHNQRADIQAIIHFKDSVELPAFSEIIELLELCGSAPVFPLLKRPDEKFITEMQYRNPKFVEDVARECIIALRSLNGVRSFSLSVKSYESIHGHDALVSHQETLTT